MLTTLADLRREYNLASLRRGDLEPDPLVQFRKWFDQAAGVRTSGRVRRFLLRLYRFGERTPAAEVNAATLATADRNGRPSARVVLLKDFDERGFIFFTNYESRKSRELTENPHATLVFYWADQARQVCVSGSVQKVSREESEAYFETRPRGSQLAAWASCQSAVVADRGVLEAQWNELQAKFSHRTIPMPPFWGGYVLVPTQLEFWQGRLNRLHDRFRYSQQPDNRWHLDRLCP